MDGSCRVRPGTTWLIWLALGGMLLSGAGHAQRPLDGELTLELLQRIERLEAEVRQMRGELEVHRYQLEQRERGAPAGHPPEARARPSAAIEWADPGAPSRAEDRLSAVASPEVATPLPAAGTEQADFAVALNEFREGRFREAIAGFRQFLSDYPESSLTGDARYWLGESYYLRRNLDAAKEVFIDMGLHDPHHARLPDALLKLGYLYGAEGDPDRAREVLEKLVQVYPDTQAASLAERRLESLR
jgi:tol-pal system protein YbgF